MKFLSRTQPLLVLGIAFCIGCGDDDGGSGADAGMGGTDALAGMGGVGGSAGMDDTGGIGGDAGMSGAAGTGDTAGASGAAGMGGSAGTGGAAGTAGATVPGARSDGQVIPPWDELCVATFTDDYDVIGALREVAFSVQAGDRYLQLGVPGFVAIVYIASEGPATFDIAADAPFTSNCPEGSTRPVIAVFKDTVVYSDQDKTMPICTLEAGTAIPGNLRAFAAGASFTTYQIEFPQLATHCNGARRGYVSRSQVSINGTSYGEPPLVTALGPLP